MKPRNNDPAPDGMSIAALFALRCVQVLAAALFGAGMVTAAVWLRYLTR